MVGLFKQYQELLGVPVDMNEVFGKLYNHALEGDADCGGLIAYNYISGEPVTGLAEGRPMFVRSANDHFNLANFMRANLYASVAVLKIGNDVLFKDEKGTGRSHHRSWRFVQDQGCRSAHPRCSH